MNTTSNSAQEQNNNANLSLLPVLQEVVKALEAVRLLEVIYGYVEDETCRIVAIANDLSSAQRDIIWKINLEYQESHPDIDVDIRLIQRRGELLSEVFQDDGTAVITREMAAA